MLIGSAKNDHRRKVLWDSDASLDRACAPVGGPRQRTRARQAATKDPGSDAELDHGPIPFEAFIQSILNLNTSDGSDACPRLSMQRSLLIFAALGLFFFGGDWQDFAAAQAPRASAVTCDNYARSYAQQSSRQGQVLRGGAVGSLVGLGLGSIAGAGGVGAAIGATVGVIGGGMRRSSTGDQMYNAAYQDCMSGR